MTPSEQSNSPDLIERVAMAAFASDSDGGHHRGGPWTWQTIGEGGRENYRRLAKVTLGVVVDWLRGSPVALGWAKDAADVIERGDAR